MLEHRKRDFKTAFELDTLERDAGLLTRIRAIMRLSKASLMEAGSLKVDLIALHCRFLQSLSEQCTVRRCDPSSLPTPLLLAIGCPSAKPGPPNPGCYVDIYNLYAMLGHEKRGGALSRRETQNLNVHFGFSAEIGLIAAAH